MINLIIYIIIIYCSHGVPRQYMYKKISNTSFELRALFEFSVFKIKERGCESQACQTYKYKFNGQDNYWMAKEYAVRLKKNFT